MRYKGVLKQLRNFILQCKTSSATGLLEKCGSDYMKLCSNVQRYIGNFLLVCSTFLTVVGKPINVLVIRAVMFIRRLFAFLETPFGLEWHCQRIFVLFSCLMLVIATHLYTSTVSSRGFYNWFVFNSYLFFALNI